MRKLSTNTNIDNSDLANYPDGRIKNNSGANDGTPVNERVYGDIHSNLAKLIRLANLVYSGLPDNETNGYQIVEALRDLGSKHDNIQNLSTDTINIIVPTKLNTMIVGEFLICKSGFNYIAETGIKGNDISIYSINVLGNFKNGEYIRIEKTLLGFTIVRLVDAINLDAYVGELNYLKKASQSQENTGTTELVATTPKTNKTVFERRVNGLDSVSYLANASQNGIYPKEHYSFVESFVNPVKNKGFISGIDIGGTSGSLIVSGDITSAIASTPFFGNSKILVTIGNPMLNTDYIVKMHAQSLSVNINSDDNIGALIFKPISNTQFEIGINEFSSGGTQNIKIHIEVEQL